MQSGGQVSNTLQNTERTPREERQE
eukprot:COSAG02_NODE_69119_length_200_cov_2.009901_1_plen_24_part_10